MYAEAKNGERRTSMLSRIIGAAGMQLVVIAAITITIEECDCHLLVQPDSSHCCCYYYYYYLYYLHVCC
jgi:hypothetical protein